VDDVLVAYGFGCDCPDELLYVDQPMPLERLLPFIAESEAADYYRVGKDNLHVKDANSLCDILLCHDWAIYFKTNDTSLFERQKAIWVARGHLRLYEKIAGDWQPVDLNRE